MPSEKLIRILQSKSSFSPEQINAMSEAAGWAWVYENEPAKRDANQMQACITGVGAVDKLALTARAEAAGIRIVGSITQRLNMLCAGPNAGPAKLQRARDQGIRVLSVEEFERVVATGELPPS